MKPDIDAYAYYDFRSLVIDAIAALRKRKIRRSRRTVAIKSGIDPSLFAKALKGQRNLTSEQAVRVAGVLGLDDRETEYFEMLVRFTQARGHEAKRRCFEQLLDMRRPPGAAPLCGDQYRFYSRWYYSVVREVLKYCGRADDYRAIAAMLIPRIRPNRAREAVELLEKLGLVRRDRGGAACTLADPFITAGPDIRAAAIRNFQAAMMDIAKDALVNVPKEEREIATSTLSLSRQGFGEVAGMLRELREKLRDVAANDTDIDGVYHVNIMAFPVARIRKGGANERD